MEKYPAILWMTRETSISCHRLTPHSRYDQEPDCYPYQETVSGRGPSERSGCDRGVYESLFSVLGEVKTPGKYSITKDQISLLEAISMAGDLTIYGKRDAIFVIREENGERVTHWVDIRSKDIFTSPVYYLKQNDVVYVQPNKVRAGQSTINENNVKSVSLWISIGSFLTSLGVLLFK